MDKEIAFFKSLIEGAENSNSTAENAIGSAYWFLHGGKTTVNDALETAFDDIKNLITDRHFMGEDQIEDYPEIPNALQAMRSAASQQGEA